MTRWFRAGAIGFIIVAVLHTFGHFGGPPKDTAALELESAMSAYRFDIMGQHPSAQDITESLSLTMSILLVFVGALDLMALAALANERHALRRLAWCNVAGAGALAVLFAYYHIPPPAVTLAVVCVLFKLAALRPAPRQR